MLRLIVSAAVIRRGPGTALLLTQRRKGAHLAGYWEFPGGKVEPGEGPEEALVRECIEEIGVRVQVLDVLEVAHHVYRDAEQAKEVFLLFYDCRILEGEVQHLQVADHAWVMPDELENFELPPPDARLIARLKAGR